MQTAYQCYDRFDSNGKLINPYVYFDFFQFPYGKIGYA